MFDRKCNSIATLIKLTIVQKLAPIFESNQIWVNGRYFVAILKYIVLGLI